MEVDTNVAYSGSFKNHYVENIMIKQVIDEVKLIPNYQVLKSDVDMIIRICLIIEQVFVKHNLKKRNKKEVFFQIYTQIFTNVTEQDKVLISNVIDNLHADGRFELKLNGKVKKFAIGIYDFFFSKSDKTAK